ncbi:hypothetical protein W97_07713 [Coniosporium apollinis CBS 100218]|uniref:Molybdopterin synthase sulfur carrier subunit n=1 Tax=Coniosporium apollinis (strain CBS 100218) TaxID=1168221 RepID=R7Z330_CONA1|nr:uncharacterized protein W97_06629 [Coniosporium apollinis CBS 100218]XP_007783820.1 uncharacterized protein W97_07713 [Coniosporium apollinis CBS 100218]EON67376.1 hypothetical protein W97_06629 [Coniosporium apollinis CBS 100218]EON68503.1 hypothetical protein W97_07713 [Coniosporium apollinis CBS 100218]
MASSKPPQGHFTLLYFAAASSFTKKSSEIFRAPLPARDLFQVLEKRYPGFTEKVLSSCAVTVNLEYIDLDEDQDGENSLVIKEGDEVAVIPPVSSG